MNVVKMSITLPLVIVLFVHGVYCPGSSGSEEEEEEEEELPRLYTLESCITDSENLGIHSSATVEFEMIYGNPSACQLIVRSLGAIDYYHFQKADVEFTSMLEEEVTLTVHGSPQTEWSMTCYFFSHTTSKLFHKFITGDRRSELVLLATMDYLKNAENTVLAEQPDLNIYYEGEGNVTIMVYGGSNCVLIFKRDSVYEIAQLEPTKIHLIIKSTNRSGRKLYKLGFPDPAQAAALIELIGERPYLNGASHNAGETSDSD